MPNIVSTLVRNLVSSRRGINDFIVSASPHLVSTAAGLITTILIARGLGPGLFGKYTLILGFSGMFAGLSDLGINTTAVRFASRALAVNDREYFFAVLRWAFRLRMMLALIVILVAVSVSPLVVSRMWGAGDILTLTNVSLLTIICSSLASIPIVYFQATRKFGRVALITSGQVAINVIVVFALALTDVWTVPWILAATIFSNAVGAVIFLLSIPRNAFLASRNELSYGSGSRFWHPPLPASAVLSENKEGAGSFAFFMLLNSVISLVITRADIWLMGIYLDDAQIGIYNVALKFTLPLAVALSALDTVLWPQFSGMVEDADVLRLMKKSFYFTTLLASALVLVSFAGPLVLPWLFGRNYGASVFLAQLLCLRFCIPVWLKPIDLASYHYGAVRIFWLINCVSLVILIGMNVLLLPRLGALGSALSLLTVAVFGNLVTGLIVWRRLFSSRKTMGHTHG